MTRADLLSCLGLALERGWSKIHMRDGDNRTICLEVWTYRESVATEAEARERLARLGRSRERYGDPGLRAGLPGYEPGREYVTLRDAENGDVAIGLRPA